MKHGRATIVGAAPAGLVAAMQLVRSSEIKQMQAASQKIAAGEYR
jgi:thioredoxin reductase